MTTATLSLHSTHSQRETRQILEETFKRERDFAQARLLKFDQECQEFEERYHMDSEQFLEQFESGELGDDVQWFDWYAVVRGRKIWERKYTILKELSWNE